MFEQTANAMLFLLVRRVSHITSHCHGKTTMFLPEMFLYARLTWTLWNTPEKDKTSQRMRREEDIEGARTTVSLELNISGRNTNW